MNELEARLGVEVERQALAIGRLKKRADFQRAARGRRARTESFTLQTNRRNAPPGDGPAGARVGFTVTKKLGGAVLRNRIRRRLKEALRLSPDLEARCDHDYVVMAQREALGRRFDLLQADLARAFSTIHASPAPAGRARRSNDRDERK